MDHLSPDHASLRSTTQIPIAQLSPSLVSPASFSINAIVTLTWPYSSITSSISFLLSEPDFRHRKARGQVRVQFSGPSGQCVASARVSSGDRLLLSLEGVDWTRDDSDILLPGIGNEFKLNFNERLLLQFQRDGSEEIQEIFVNNPSNQQSTASLLRGLTPEIEHVLANSPVKSNITPGGLTISEDSLYSSPAFLKRSRANYGSLFDSSFLDEADEAVQEKGRKKSRLSLAWSYYSQSSASEEEENEAQISENANKSKTMFTQPVMVDEGVQTNNDDSNDQRRSLESVNNPIPTERKYSVSNLDIEATQDQLVPDIKSNSKYSSGVEIPQISDQEFIGKEPPISMARLSPLSSNNNPEDTSIDKKEIRLANSVDTTIEQTYVDHRSLIITEHNLNENQSSHTQVTLSNRETLLIPSHLAVETIAATNSEPHEFSYKRDLRESKPTLITDSTTMHTEVKSVLDTKEREEDESVNSRLGHNHENDSQINNCCPSEAHQVERTELYEEESQLKNTHVAYALKENNKLDKDSIETRVISPVFYESPENLFQQARTMNEDTESQMECPYQESMDFETQNYSHDDFKECEDNDIHDDKSVLSPGSFEHYEGDEINNFNDELENPDYNKFERSSPTVIDLVSSEDEIELTTPIPTPVNPELNSTYIELSIEPDEENYSEIEEHHILDMDHVEVEEMEEIFVLKSDQIDEKDPTTCNDQSEYVNELHENDPQNISLTLAGDSGEGQEQYIFNSQEYDTAGKQIECQLSESINVQTTTIDEDSTTKGILGKKNSSIPEVNEPTKSSHEEILHIEDFSSSELKPRKDMIKEKSTEILCEGSSHSVNSTNLEEEKNHPNGTENAPQDSSPDLEKLTRNHRHDTRSAKSENPSTKNQTSIVALPDSIKSRLRGHDASIELALSSLTSPSKRRSPPPLVGMKLKLARILRTDLCEYTSLKLLRYHQNTKLDVLAIVASPATLPKRVKGGPRDYLITFNITDPTIAPSGIAGVQIFRPYQEALPVVEVGDGILLRNFQIFTENKHFYLRSKVEEGSSWAVFKSNGEIQVKGPPIEHSEAEIEYTSNLKLWFSDLDTVALAKIDRANEKLAIVKK